MRRIKEGDADALQALMASRWVDLVRYATALMGRRDDGQDVAQEVFVRVWQKRSAWTERRSVDAYLWGIARNLILPRLRHDRVRARTVPEVRRLWRRPPSPFESTAYRELSEALEAALRRLPVRRRQAFELVRLQGMSLSEAAGAMEVTRRTVANHLYLASVDLAGTLRAFLS